LKYPKLIPELASFGVPPSGGLSSKSSKPPKGGTPNILALNWGYEANHPFEKETRLFARSGIPFYVCPGTSTWQTLIGRHDNALANLRAAAKAGRKHSAIGYLITDWGDGGHPQPLTVSWPMFLAGAALAWNANGFNEELLQPVLSRDVFGDSTGRIAGATFKLGFVHSQLKAKATNETPLGTVIAAPPVDERELFCRNGLKWFKKITAANIRATLKGIERQRAVVKNVGRRHAVPAKSKLALLELDLAARMAAQSCKFMLWQQALAQGGRVGAPRRPDAAAQRPYQKLAQTGIRELLKLDKDFNRYWASRNKATPKHCSAFLRWRINDYRRFGRRSFER
jgi:hypothetical protein